MLAPLVLPEGLVVAGGVLPEGVHVGQEVGLAVGLEDGGDVGVLAGAVAEGVVGAVAVVGPGNIVSLRLCISSSPGLRFLRGDFVDRRGEGGIYQRPWRVQELLGPVLGLASQN